MNPLALRLLRGSLSGRLSCTTLFALLAPLAASADVGPVLRADYRFQNTLTSVVPGAPSLADLGPNTFGSDTVDGAGRTVLFFGENDGLSLAPFSTVAPFGPYSIVILFRFEATSGWRRILDFKDATSDTGLYSFEGGLNFYNEALGSGTPVVPGSYVQVVLTRDPLQQVTGYVDGDMQFSFPDSGGLATVSASVLRLFRDTDPIFAGEASAGAIARLRIYDGALVPAAVAALDRLPGVVPSTVQFAQGSLEVSEGSGLVPVSVTRAGGLTNTATVSWSLVSGTATAGVDFLETGGMLTFTNGQTSAIIFLTVVDDSEAEGTETAVLQLGTPSGATLGNPSQMTITLLDNDPCGPLVASDDFVTAPTQAGVSFPVLTNDVAPCSPSFGVSVVGPAGFGNAYVYAGGQAVLYQSFPGYCGPDSFAYTITNQTGQSASATVNVTVVGCPSNQPPLAVDDYWGAQAGVEEIIPVLDNDSDSDLDPLALFAVTQPQFGGATISGTDVVYSPLAGSAGLDSFTYVITDFRGGYATGAVFITVTNHSQADLAVGLSVMPPAIFVGDMVQATLTLTNLGPDIATNIQVRAPADPALTPTGHAATDGTVFDPLTSMWLVPVLPQGGMATLDLLMQATSIGTVTLHADLENSSPSDPNEANNHASTSLQVNEAAADLGVTLILTPEVITPEIPGHLSFIVSNAGPSIAEQAMLLHPLTPNLAVQTVDVSQGTYGLENGILTCHLGRLAPGEWAQVTLVVAAQAPGPFLTEASVSSEQPDTQTGNNTATGAGLVLEPPVITLQPVSASVPAGANVILSSAAAGSPPLSYQWRFAGTNLPGATSSTLLLVNVTPQHAGVYQLVVTNPVGMAQSDQVSLEVRASWTVTAQPGPGGTVAPGSQSVLAGATAVATAVPLMNYTVDRWWLDGMPAQSGGMTFTLVDVQTNHSLQVTFRTLDPCLGVAVNFVNAADMLESGEIAGVTPQDGWLNAVGPAGQLTLSGGAGIQWQAASTIALQAPASSADHTLMRGGLDSPNAATLISVTGLTLDGPYDVYVYCAGDNAGTGQTRVGAYTLDGQTRFALDAPDTPDFGGVFVESASIAGGPGAALGNCVVFRNLTGPGFVLSAAGDYASGGALRAPINALQIVPQSVATATPFQLGIQPAGPGTIRLHISGNPGHPVAVEAADALALWNPVASLENPLGLVEYTESVDPAAPARFYRAAHDGFPGGTEPMVFFGAAPAQPGSQATLILPGGVGLPQLVWTSTDPVLGAIQPGLLNAGQWVMVPASGNCPPRILFRATQAATNLTGAITFGGSGNLTLDLRTVISNVVRQVRYILACPVDLDLDSDNTNGLGAPDRSPREDQIEDDPNRPGKILCVNNGDADADGVPDHHDGFNADGVANTADDTAPNTPFVRVVLELPPPLNPAIAKVRFTYSASDPAKAYVTKAPTNTTFVLPAGHLRLWQKDGPMLRDARSVAAGGDFVPAGAALPAAALGFTAGQRTRTFFIEAVAPGTRPGDQRIQASVDPGDAVIAAFCSDAVRSTSIRLKLAAAGVRDADRIKRGAVVTLNNDNDDYLVGATHNFEPDLTQRTVANEDDLLPLNISMDLSGLTTGWVQLELALGTNVALWTATNKTNLLIDRARYAVGATAAQAVMFRQPLHLEGVFRSSAVKDNELKLSYRLDRDQPVLCESKLKVTVVELLLDANRDGVLTNDLPVYQPGYARGAGLLAGLQLPVISAGSPEQHLHVLATPLTAEVVDTVRFTLSDATAFPGHCMNQGSDSRPDFSLTSPAHGAQRDIQAFNNNRATSDLYCRDYGGRAVVDAAYLRSTSPQPLARSELRVPLDTDRDTLPDFYETAHRDDPVRATQVLDVRDVQTKAIPGVAARPAGQHDHETQNPASAGVPANGVLGDGLTAFEEYRGFMHGDHANANHRHFRTSPHTKDVFGFSNVQDINAANTDIGLGYLLDPAGGASALGASRVTARRINANEWNGQAVREINFNRAGIPNATRQCAIFMDQSLRPGFGDLGVARGGINTGPNGVCNTLVANAGNAALRLDFQIIPRDQGLADQPAIRPGANGFIEPLIAAGDRLDPSFSPPRIVSATADGALHTLTRPAGVNARGYTPDDRVRGTITNLTGFLTHNTVAATHANDVLRGEIREGADNQLEPATVLNASANDALATVVIDPNGNGLQTVVDPRDTVNPNGTVSGGRPNGGFFTAALGGNDIFRGKITEGADNNLQSRPANASDIVAGHISEGADNELLSRPAAGSADIVRGWVEDAPGGDNDTLDPTINNAPAATVIAGSAAVALRYDDLYDPATRTVMTGPDGIRDTNPQPGADDQQFIAAAGQGTPFAACVDPDDRDGVDETGPPPPGTHHDDATETAPAGDDIVSNSNDPADSNSDVNDCTYAYIPVNAFNSIFNLFQLAPLPPPAPAGPPFRAIRVAVDGRVAAAANDGRRQDLLKRTTGHEAGHCMHLAHYNFVRANLGGGVFNLTPPAGHTVNGSLMIQTGSTITPVSRVFDNTDLQQIRLHQKHP
jgi:hypothetical protein